MEHEGSEDGIVGMMECDGVPTLSLGSSITVCTVCKVETSLRYLI